MTLNTWFLEKTSAGIAKMTLTDKKFGSEIVTKEGEAYKFDDIGCQMRFLNSNAELRMDYAYELVVDYAHPGELIDAHEALYLQSNMIKGPMGGSIAAFNSQKEFDGYDKDWHGKRLSWGDLITQYK